MLGWTGTVVRRVSCRWIECGLGKVAMREVWIGDQQPKRFNDDSCSANAKQALKLDAVAKVDDLPQKAQAQAQAQSGGGFAAGPYRARDRKLWSLCRRRRAVEKTLKTQRGGGVGRQWQPMGEVESANIPSSVGRWRSGSPASSDTD